MTTHSLLSFTQNPKSILILLMAASMFLSTGCNKKKKLAEEMARQEKLAAEEAEKEAKEREMDMIRNQLQALIDNPARNMDELRDKERQLMQIKYQNIDDPDIQAMIKKAEYELQREREELMARENEGREEAGSVTAKDQLLDHFQSISNADSPNLANIRIERALEMFSSGNAPVLIVISDVGGRREYDRPTTIKKYLNYLKDQGKNADYIDQVIMDNNGKIKELELIKR
ncbi:MAG: hypothetical protein AAGD28_06330 [Bacteroidota bacterium]